MSKEKEIKLLPCPFCGSKAEFLVYAGEENRKHTHMVSCMADNSDHHGKEGVSEDWCPMELETDWCLTKEDAAKIWNTRPDTEPIEALAELAKQRLNNISMQESVASAGALLAETEERLAKHEWISVEAKALRTALEEIARNRDLPGFHGKTFEQQSKLWESAWNDVTRIAQQAINVNYKIRFPSPAEPAAAEKAIDLTKIETLDYQPGGEVVE